MGRQEGGDEGMQDTRGSKRESKRVENNERKRGGQGQPEAVFPPHSLLGSGVTRKLAMFHTPNAEKHIKTPPHNTSLTPLYCFFLVTFTRGNGGEIRFLAKCPYGIFCFSNNVFFL
uniref:PPUP8095 n=1 Tax=Poeciliopsis prolifica TaxID=188132 RepID=A0A0S7ERV7_9TELE